MMVYLVFVLGCREGIPGNPYQDSMVGGWMSLYFDCV